MQASIGPGERRRLTAASMSSEDIVSDVRLLDYAEKTLVPRDVFSRALPTRVLTPSIIKKKML